jgi:hypothetical protein
MDRRERMSDIAELGRELEAFRSLKKQLEEEIKTNFPFMKEEPVAVNKVVEFIKSVSQWLVFAKKEKGIMNQLTGGSDEFDNEFWKAINNILVFDGSIWYSDPTTKKI